MRPNKIFVLTVLPALILLLTLLPAHAEIPAFAAPESLQPPPPSDPNPEQLPPGDEEARAAADGPSYIERVVEIVNQERWANGQYPPLKQVNLLDSAAGTHSENMALRNFFAHCDLDTGASPWDRMAAAGYSGYSSAGENIAAGYGSPESAMSAWMNSSGHRSNILSTGYRELGVGYYYQNGDQGNIRMDTGSCTPGSPSYGPYYHYWTQNFGRRSSVYPVVINREAYETTSRSVMIYMYGSGWAEEMRFCNANSTWSPWESYNPDVPWTLSAGNGRKSVLAEIRSGTTVISSYDSIYLTEAVNDHLSTLTEYLHLPMVTFTAVGSSPPPTCGSSN
jgi:uncharacterized protein YkwD